MKKNVVRIKDIAEKANVSTGTVDRVLHKRGRVSEEVRQRVLKIARELNYEPNMLARALVNNRTYKIAVLIPDSSIDDYWKQPEEGIEKAESQLKQYGIQVTQLKFDPFNPESYKEKAKEVTEDQFDGVLVAPVFYRESLSFFNLWKRKAIPFILFNTHIPDYEPLMYLGQDSYQSGILAGKLMQYSHTSSATFLVAHINEDVLNSSHLIKKEQGFVDYFSQFSTSSSFNIIQADFKTDSDNHSFAFQFSKLLQKNSEIKGIFVTNSRASIVADFLDSNGMRDMRLIGYDLLKRNIHYLNKGVIDFLINQNPLAQGYWGIHAFAEHLIYKVSVPPVKYLPLDIITRENLEYYTEVRE